MTTNDFPPQPSLEFEDADPTTPRLVLPSAWFASNVDVPRIDALCLEAGPRRALVANSSGIVASIAWDHERGAPLEQIDPAGWVS